MTPTFTIMLPVFRPPDLLEFSIQSVLKQTRGDFELGIICDGAPDETVALARRFAEQDERIIVHARPKGRRNGEDHRREFLENARGRFVCQIADDDLWFPDHLAEIEKLLEERDFGNTLHMSIGVDGAPDIYFADIGDKRHRSRMLSSPFNFFGPTVSGYRLEAYRRIPDGWSPAPQDVWSDLWMWRKFFSLPDLRVGTRFCVTALVFPALSRKHCTLRQRQEEMKIYADCCQLATWRDQMIQRAMIDVAFRYLNVTNKVNESKTALVDVLRGVSELKSRVEKIKSLEQLQFEKNEILVYIENIIKNKY